MSAYYTTWINSGMHHATRWHWDRLAVNPHAGNGFAAPSAAPSFCLGQPNNTCPDPAQPGASTPVPTSTTPPAQATSTPIATATAIPPTRTPVPTSTPPGAAELQARGRRPCNFDDLSSPNRTFSGQYPSGVINWGSNAWYLSGPYDKFRANSFSFNGSALTSGSFCFTSPRTLTALDVDNGGTTTTTVTLACGNQPTIRKSLAAGQTATIMTGWSAPCTTVTLTSTNGWYVNFDNLQIQ